ncbi:MAG: hypothetical protein R2765_06350 [Ferruginibacter sp.]
MKYYSEALAIGKKTGFKRLELTCMLGLGDIYFHRYDADGMQPFYEKSLALSKAIGDKEGEVIAGRGMAFLYLLKKILHNQKYISESLRIADSMDLKIEKVNGMKMMSNILFAMQDIVGAEKLLEWFTGYRESTDR